MPNTKNGVLPERLAKFCREHHIRRLALIGHVPGRRKGSFKDDLLVEFEPDQPIGYIALVGTEFKLSRLLRHKVELYTPGSFRGGDRKKVVKEARDLFASRAIPRRGAGKISDRRIVKLASQIGNPMSCRKSRSIGSTAVAAAIC